MKWNIPCFIGIKRFGKTLNAFREMQYSLPHRGKWSVARLRIIEHCPVGAKEGRLPETKFFV